MQQRRQRRQRVLPEQQTHSRQRVLPEQQPHCACGQPPHCCHHQHQHQHQQHGSSSSSGGSGQQQRHGRLRGSSGRLLLLVLLAAAAAPPLCCRPAAAARPAVGTVCCPSNRTRLPEGRTPTAFLSYPGSGNTWVRHILEMLTGYTTTSIYCDKTLRGVFPAECDGSALYGRSLVVKSHRLKYCRLWQRALVVVRNPLHSIRTEYQRMATHSHTAYVSADSWDWDDWYETSTRMCGSWTRMFQEILGNGDYPGCATRDWAPEDHRVFFYDDLKLPGGELNPRFLDELLAFFGISRKDAFYECALRYNRGQYERRLPADHPAARLESDPETLRRFEQAGCLAVYEQFKRRYPRLPPPAGAAGQQGLPAGAGNGTAATVAPAAAAQPQQQMRRLRGATGLQ